MTRRALSAVVLAAGSGSRMRSRRPKPLHLICGRPLLLYSLDSLAAVEVARTVVVVGPGAERITKRIGEDAPDLHVDFIEQVHPRGTADAVAAGLSALPEDDSGDDDVLVVAGDLPLLSAATVAGLVEQHRLDAAACTLLVARGASQALGGRSRVVRGRRGTITQLVRPEEWHLPALVGDGVDDEGATLRPAVEEAAALACCFKRSALGPALRRVVPDPLDGEYRLFDVVEVLDRAGFPVGSYEAGLSELDEVGDRATLAAVEAEIRRRVNLAWARSGVTFVDLATAYIDATVTLGRDVTIFPNTLLQGRTVVGEGAEVGPDTRLVDCVVGPRARLQVTSGRNAQVGEGAVVGPFVALEPGAEVPDHAQVAPFTTLRQF